MHNDFSASDGIGIECNSVDTTVAASLRDLHLAAPRCERLLKDLSY